MKARHVTSLLGALALALSFRAGAATISLQPSAALVPQTSTFTVTLMIDALDAPGGHPAQISGIVVLDFNPALISYDSFALAAGVSFLTGTGVAVGSSGGHQTLTVGFNGGPESGPAGTFTFTASGAPQSIATIGLDDALSLFGSFVNTVPTNQAFYPAFNGTSVQISSVPLPPTVWLLLTAFGAASARLRRVSRSVRGLR